MKYTLGELAEITGATVQGDKSCIIEGVATLQHANDRQITFLTNTVYRKQLADTNAAAVILSAVDAESYDGNALICDNPYAVYAIVAAQLAPSEKYAAGIDDRAVVAEDAIVSDSASIAAGVVIESGVKIAEHVRVGPGCVVMRHAEIGKNTTLVANVTIAHECIIGHSSLLHPGVVVGADGFGQAMDAGNWIKVPQLGKVVIGNDVEIGANTTIDRGAIEDTIIEDNVKLDNQIQVAHNVIIGAHTAIAGCTAIAGSTKIGKYCKIGGMVGIVGHLEIADNVMVTAKSLVSGSIRKAGVYSGSAPLQPSQQWRKNSIRFKQLDDIARRLSHLEKTLSSKEESGE